MKKNQFKAVIALLFFLALASFASAENITYRYLSSSGSLISANSTVPPFELNVTLPNTTWNLELINNDSRFKVTLPNINASQDGSGYPVLNITARTVDLAVQNYDGPVVYTGSGYVAKYAYAFNITEYVDRQYNVTFDYSSIAGVSSPVIWKCDFNFTGSVTNTSSCTQLTTYVDYTNKLASATATNFSSFFLTQYVAPGGGSTGGTGGTGGGGGGGGGGATPRIIYVSPTPEGASIQVYSGDEIIVQYKGSEYHYKVSSVGDWKVSLKDLQSYLPVDIKLGEIKTLGLSSFFAREVELSMYVSNRFAMLTFKSIDKQPFLYPLIPARPSTKKAPSPLSALAGGQAQQVYVPRPVPAATGAAQPSAGVSQALQLPESPINLWTIIFAVVFVIFLVGSLALYRSRLHRLEKPPTVTRTGLEPAGLPETSSNEVSKPAPVLMQEAKPDVKQAAKPAVVEKPKRTELSHAKRLELEKYIFHALSSGFKESQIRKALLDKGWPEDAVDGVFRDISAKK